MGIISWFINQRSHHWGPHPVWNPQKMVDFAADLDVPPVRSLPAPPNARDSGPGGPASARDIQVTCSEKNGFSRAISSDSSRIFFGIIPSDLLENFLENLLILGFFGLDLQFYGSSYSKPIHPSLAPSVSQGSLRS